MIDDFVNPPNHEYDFIEAVEYNGEQAAVFAGYTRNNTAYIFASGEVDQGEAPTLKSILETRAENNPEVRAVEIDVSGVTFLGSSGLGVLVSAYKRLRESDRALRVVNPLDSVRYVLRITGLLEILVVEPKDEE